MKTAKSGILFRAALVVVAVVFLNLLAQRFFTRVDLTEEGRYTLSDLTKNTVDSLPDVVNVRVLLAGELPPSIERFRAAVQAFLDELKARGGKNFQYQFIDPRENGPLLADLKERGITPLPFSVREDNAVTRVELYPAVFINYREKERFVDLLGDNCQLDPAGEVVCDWPRAEAKLEYRFTRELYRILQPKDNTIGFLASNSLLPFQAYRKTLLQELAPFYRVLPVRVDSGYALPNSATFLPANVQAQLDPTATGLDVLIVPQPARPFTQRELYELDQFVMRGGRVIWAVDRVFINDDDFLDPNKLLTVTQTLNHNLQLLYNAYGCILQPALIQDLSMFPRNFPVFLQGQLQAKPFKWVYYPVVRRLPEHPVTQGVDYTVFREANFFDTLPQPGVTATPLAVSSGYSRPLNSPLQINWRKTVQELPPEQVFQNQGFRTMALLLEGDFQSAFAGQKPPTDSSAPAPPSAKQFVKAAVPGKQLFIADGEFLLPDYRYVQQGIFVYPGGNKNFLLNALDYLINDRTFYALRQKDIPPRFLDAQAVASRAFGLKLQNVALPVVLILLAGGLRFGLRRRRNRRFHPDRPPA